ncbi:MAG: hypothetical protein WA160_10515 [Pseudobdellovibrio sp.]
MDNFGEILSSYLSIPLQEKYILNHKKSAQQLVPANITASGAHAIHDLESYVDNRIGHGTFKEISKNNMKILVVGGFSQNLNCYLSQLFNTETIDVIKIPTLYEAWGLSKYLVPAQGKLKSPTLIWIVPPALRYVRHYLTSFGMFSKTKPIGFVDNAAVNNYKQLAKHNAKIVSTNVNIDYLAFGYEKTWLTEIKKTENLKVLKLENVQSLALGITFKVIHIFDSNKMEVVKIGLIASDLTVWGELAAIQVENFLNPKLKGVIFLGSAGSIDEKVDIYDLSVPASFFRPGKKITIKNFLLKSLPEPAEAMITVHTHSRHGNTFSPIEQNVPYLKAAIKKGINTIDVEQSLIAEVIDAYNLKNKTEIKFGAVNIVTDKPYAILTNELVQNSLDVLNYELKQKAREQAVSISLKGIFFDDEYNKAKLCSELF